MHFRLGGPGVGSPHVKSKPIPSGRGLVSPLADLEKNRPADMALNVDSGEKKPVSEKKARPKPWRSSSTAVRYKALVAVLLLTMVVCGVYVTQFWSDPAEVEPSPSWEVHIKPPVRQLTNTTSHTGSSKDRNGRGDTDDQGVGGQGGDSMRCENTKQGRSIITDDRGYLCARQDVDTSGCCPVYQYSEQFSCQACRPDIMCCKSFEYCVSCCMSPANRKALRITEDEFHTCQHICRTSSRSIRGGNRYKSHEFRHCYWNRHTERIDLDYTDSKIVTSKEGQSCVDACNGESMTCDENYFRDMNSCDLMKDHFPCERGCEPHPGSDHPSYTVMHAPDDVQNVGLCLISGSPEVSLACAAQFPFAQRLCICIPDTR